VHRVPAAIYGNGDFADDAEEAGSGFASTLAHPRTLN
jgi:hypothetical protein